MRATYLLLTLILLVALPAIGRAADLMLPVPVTDVAYTQLRQLNRWAILTEGQEALLDEKNQRVLTRYDITLLLVEPLERCTALVDVQENAKVLPEQRRRAEMACFTFSKMSASEMNTAITALNQLLRSFGSDIDQLSPGLNRRAGFALQKLLLPTFRPWLKNENTSTMPVIHVSIAPHEPDSLSDPWLFLSPSKNVRAPLALRANGGDTSDNPLLGSRAMSSLAAAADVAIGRFKLYGTVSTLPGGDPTMSILKPDGTGRAMLGIEIGLVRLKDFGISGIFEYHIMRTGDQTNHDTNTGVGGGIGVSW